MQLYYAPLACLHKATYIPLLIPSSPDGAKAFAREKLPLRFEYLNKHLGGRNFLLDSFTVADAYLVTVLNWSPYAGIDLVEWPAVKAYYETIRKRPSVAKAFAEEGAAYAEEVARRAVA